MGSKLLIAKSPFKTYPKLLNADGYVQAGHYKKSIFDKNKGKE
jgi:hypothetical protein